MFSFDYVVKVASRTSCALKFQSELQRVFFAITLVRKKNGDTTLLRGPYAKEIFERL